MRASQQSALGNVLEPLESRTLFASYAAALYFPLRSGAFWDYTGSFERRDADLERMAVSDRIDATAVTRLDDVIRADDTSAGRMSRYYSFSRLGLNLHRQSIDSGLGISDVTLQTPIRLLNATARDGNVIRWSRVPLRAVLDVPDHDPVTGTGTDSGTSRVVGREAVDLGEGQIVGSALKITLDHTQTFDVAGEGSRAHVVARIVEHAWLARDIGVVRFEGTVDITATVDGETETDHLSQSFLLDGSSLMPNFFTTRNAAHSTVTVHGTVAPDVLAISARGRQIIVASGAITEIIDRTGIQRIEVLAGGGNDRITIGAGIYSTGIDGGSGNDVIIGSVGADRIRGGTGRDTIDGAGGNDRIFGDGHSDVLRGGAGNDQLFGGSGDDTLIGGAGSDLFDGGIGIDTASDETVGELLLGIER